MKVNVIIEVEDNCIECPYCEDTRTIEAGYALDYWCIKMSPRKKIMGYVEYQSDVKPIPDWCPFRN